MAEQNFQVILSSSQYDELKKGTQHIKQLTQKLNQSDALMKKKSQEMKNLRRELRLKDEENSFLIGLFEQLKNPNLQNLKNIESAGSQSFEILGESIFVQQKNDYSKERKTQLQGKYSLPMNVVLEIVQKLQSQNILIDQLNQRQIIKQENNDKIMHQLFESIEKASNKKVRTNIELVQMVKKLSQIDHEKLEKQRQKEINESDKKIQSLEGQVSKFNEIHKFQSARIEQLISEIEALEQLINKRDEEKPQRKNSQSKGDKGYRIKLLIDEYIKEVQEGLKNLGGLSEPEIRKILKDEMKQITEYVSKSIGRFNDK